MNNLLTASRMSSLLQCPRKHFWQFEVGLRAETDALALRFGKAWHLAMEARWNGADFEGALSAAIPETVTLDEQTIATLSGLLAGYFHYYQNENLIKKVHAEVQFEHPLSGSRTFNTAGKMDGLCELHDGRLALKEDKTTASSLDPDSDYWLRLRFNSQLMQYVLAARQLGWDVSTIIYDVVRKPAIEPKQISLTDDQGRKIVWDAEGQRVFKTKSRPVLDENGKKIVLDEASNRVLKPNGEPRESADTAKGYKLKTEEYVDYDDPRLSGDAEKGWFEQSRTETPEEFSTRLAADTQARPDFYFARREVPIIEQDLEEFAAQRLTLSRMILNCRQMEKKLSRREQAWPRNVDERNCNGCAYSNFCLQNLSVDLSKPPVGFKVLDFNPELAKEAA